MTDSAPRTDTRVEVRIPESLHRAAKIAAARAGVTLSLVVREALEKFVREEAR